MRNRGTKRTVPFVPLFMFTPDGAQVSGDDNNTVTVEGNHVTVRNTTTHKVLYELSGAAQDGSVKLYSSERQAVVLNGVELTNPKGAAINNQGRKKFFSGAHQRRRIWTWRWWPRWSRWRSSRRLVITYL